MLVQLPSNGEAKGSTMLSDNKIPALDDEVRQKIESSIQSHYDAIKKINDKIWNNPELAWKETTAHDAICDYFESLGSDYKVTRQAYKIGNMVTSFLVEATKTTLQDHDSFSGGPPRTVVFNAEYDALPITVKVEGPDQPKSKPAHACGHNLIASASIAGFIACWESLKDAPPNIRGTVKLLGTPAEENGGGKITLLKQGAYVGASACLMAHPGPRASDRDLKALAFTRTLASQGLTADFQGLQSHAGMAPWKGRNALDALVNAYVGISTMRQQLEPTQRVSGYVKLGGTAANIIPEHTQAVYSIRAERKDSLDDLKRKVKSCFQAGADAANCTVIMEEPHEAYWDMISNDVLCHHFTDRMNEFGVKTVYKYPEITNNPGAASDQGNVSYVVPAIQPSFFLDNEAVNHQPPFAEAAGTKDAFKKALDCGKGLAAVGLDVLTGRADYDAIQKVFKAQVAAKAATVVQAYDKVDIPTQEQIDRLLASPPPSLAPMLDIPDIVKEQVIGALMAADVFHIPLNELE